MPLFCPRCGVPLEHRAGKPLRCVPGDMELSANLERGLRECFLDGARTPQSRPLRFKVGGVWFCPGCGVREEVVDGDVRCPRCRRSLNEFI